MTGNMDMESRNRPVILIGRLKSTAIIVNALTRELPVSKVIVEEPEPRLNRLRRRFRTHGFVKVAGQLLFQIIIIPYLRIISKNRLKELNRIYGFNTSPINTVDTISVRSVNSEKTKAILEDLNPQIVIVYGTRIISDRILKSIPGTFINMHPGISPRFRGLHGGYWALATGCPQAFGVTVHRVDQGIDTGEILGQVIITPEGNDTFLTYPWIQIGEGLPLFKKVIRQSMDNQAGIQTPLHKTSRIWSHPTIWEFIRHWIVNRVK